MANTNKIFAVIISALLLWSCAPADQPADDAASEEQAADNTLTVREGVVDIDGRQIHYVIRGEGPACIVLTNSWGLNYKPLTRLFADLEDVFTLIYFDPRGMGESSPVQADEDMSMKAVREDAIAVLDHLGLEEAYVMGWSNGAANTYMFAGEYPERVVAAIALHGIEKTTTEDQEYMTEKAGDILQEYGQYMQTMADPEISEEEKESVHKALYAKWFPMMLADREATLSAMEAIFEEAEFSYKHSAFSSAEGQAGLDATEALQKVEDPMLIIAGSHDMLPVESSMRAANLVENSTFVVFEQSGHFAPIEEPAKFKETIIQFINSVK